MKGLLYTLGVAAMFIIVANMWGILASIALGVILIAIILWNKRILIKTYLASQAYFVKGDREKAYNLYQSAFKSGMMTPGSKVSFAAFCLYTNRYEKCRMLLNSVINSSLSTDTDRLNARHYSAILIWKEGNLDEAIEIMEKVHEDAKSTSTYASLGAFYVEKSKQDGAYHQFLDFMLEAYDYNDTDKTIVDNLGEIYILTGEFVKADELYSKLFKTAQLSPVPHYHYALVLKNLGKKEEAKDYLEKALTCNFARALTVSRDMIKEELATLQ